MRRMAVAGIVTLAACGGGEALDEVGLAREAERVCEAVFDGLDGDVPDFLTPLLDGDEEDALEAATEVVAMVEDVRGRLGALRAEGDAADALEDLLDAIDDRLDDWRERVERLERGDLDVEDQEDALEVIRDHQDSALGVAEALDVFEQNGERAGVGVDCGPLIP